MIFRALAKELRLRTNLWKYVVNLRNQPRLWPKRTVIKRIGGGVLFPCDIEFDLIGMQMYWGLYERPVVRAMRRFLKRGDTFIDVGANIGYLSAVGAALVGTSGSVHSFEPVPSYFRKLQEMAGMNPDYAIIPHQVALGEREEAAVIIYTSKTSIGSNTVIPDLNPRDEVDRTFDVRMVRLDSYIEQAGIRQVSLIKIDTEGFEYPILKGLQRFLEKADVLPIMIVEIAPAAYPLLSFSLRELSEYVKNHGYHAYRLGAIDTVELDLPTLESTTNVVLVPDLRVGC